MRGYLQSQSKSYDYSSLPAHQQTLLDDFIASLMAKYNINTVGYALIHDYKIITANTINGSTSCNISSLFQACSLSKSVTAYAILDLVAQNKIQLDVSVNTYLVSWKVKGSRYADLVTVRQCLNMTSGLCFGDAGATFSDYSRGAPIPSLVNILNGEVPATNSPIKVINKPGSKYYYSGASFMVLQQLLEDVAGQKYEVYMNNGILPQLGMTNSIFECPLNEEEQVNIISGYKVDGVEINGGWNNIVGAASGGLWSCPIDIARYIVSLAKCYVEQNDLIKEMLSAQNNTDFGLGVVIDGEDNSFNFRKNGHNSGYHAQFIMFTKYGSGMVVMTNSTNGIDLINELIVFVSKKFNWPIYKLNFEEV